MPIFKGVFMVKIILVIVYALICLLLSGIILLQEGKSAGLGSIAGMGDSYWSKAKSRSMEGQMSRITTILAILFLIVSFALNKVW